MAAESLGPGRDPAAPGAGAAVLGQRFLSRRLGGAPETGGQREQEPGERVLEEGGVDERVQEQRAVGGRHRRAGDREHAGPGDALAQLGAQAAEQQRERERDEREVGGEAEYALLGGHGQRDRVRGGGDPLGADALALPVALGERTG